MSSPPRLSSSRLPLRRGDDGATDGGDVSPGTAPSGGGSVLGAVTSRANNESSATIVGDDGSAEMIVVGGSSSGVIAVGVVSSSPKQQLGDPRGPRLVSSPVSAGRRNHGTTVPTLPFEAIASIVTFLPITVGLVDRLCKPLTKNWDTLQCCCYQGNWSYLAQALAAGPVAFRRFFPKWFARNENYLDDIAANESVPERIRAALTNPSMAVRLDCVDLLEHLLAATPNVDVNSLFPYLTALGHPELDFGGNVVSKHLVAVAIDHGSRSSLELLLLRADIDVHSKASENEDFGDYQLVPSALVEAAESPHRMPLLQDIIRHPSFDPNRPFLHPRSGSMQTVLDHLIAMGVLYGDFQAYLVIMEMLIVAGADAHFRVEAGATTPYEYAWQLVASADREVSGRARRFANLMRTIPAAIRIGSVVRGHLARLRLLRQNSWMLNTHRI